MTEKGFDFGAPTLPDLQSELANLGESARFLEARLATVGRVTRMSMPLVRIGGEDELIDMVDTLEAFEAVAGAAEPSVTAVLSVVLAARRRQLYVEAGTPDVIIPFDTPDDDWPEDAVELDGEGLREVLRTRLRAVVDDVNQWLDPRANTSVTPAHTGSKPPSFEETEDDVLEADIALLESMRTDEGNLDPVVNAELEIVGMAGFWPHRKAEPEPEAEPSSNEVNVAAPVDEGAGAGQIVRRSEASAAPHGSVHRGRVLKRAADLKKAVFNSLGSLPDAQPVRHFFTKRPPTAGEYAESLTDANWGDELHDFVAIKQAWLEVEDGGTLQVGALRTEVEKWCADSQKTGLLVDAILSVSFQGLDKGRFERALEIQASSFGTTKAGRTEWGTGLY